MGQLSYSSELPISPETFWEHSTHPASLNREFSPFLAMTFPEGVADLVSVWEPGKVLFRSWILLGGILPVEYDDLCFVEVIPGRGFLERSSMLSQRLWEHERTIEPLGDGCRVTDRVRYEPRVPGTGFLFAPMFHATFWWRHRQIRRLFDR